MTTRFDMENQAIQRRIADYLKRIADALEKLINKETGSEADYFSGKHSAGDRRQRSR